MSAIFHVSSKENPKNKGNAFYFTSNTLFCNVPLQLQNGIIMA